MADPFEALRAPLVAVDPDPSFAAHLRTRVEQALDLPRGAAVPDLTLDAEATPATAPVTGVVPYLAVADARRALEWYVEAFAARHRSEPIVMPDGRVGHAELEVAGGVLMLADEFPDIGVAAPGQGQGASVTLHISVADVDALTRRAVAAGATLERAPADHPYGRNAVIRDPFGHRWLISAEPSTERRSAVPRHGDVVYASLWVLDVERATTFFSTVLGWRYAPGTGRQGRQVEGTTPRLGLWGGQQRSTMFLCFAVDDVEVATERVRAAGGHAREPRQEPHGTVADCVDDQGVPFAVWQAVPGSGGARRAATRAHQGDVAYLTMEVADSSRARAFYSSVLRWRFTPGRVEDGWQVEDVAPMVGMVGGQERATVVPMYRVDDIAAAVERVRAAGGTATYPERQPYGVWSRCTDDQGNSFHLGQL